MDPVWYPDSYDTGIVEQWKTLKCGGAVKVAYQEEAAALLGGEKKREITAAVNG